MDDPGAEATLLPGQLDFQATDSPPGRAAGSGNVLAVEDAGAAVRDHAAPQSFSSHPGIDGSWNISQVATMPPAAQVAARAAAIQRAASQDLTHSPEEARSPADTSQSWASRHEGSECISEDDSEDLPPLKLAHFPGIGEEHVKQAFDEIDYDGNGWVGPGELRYLLMLQGERPTDEEIDEMMRMLDCNENGQVDYYEFRMLLGPGSLVPEEMLALIATADSPEKRQLEEHQAMLKAKEEAGPTTKQMDRMLQGASAFKGVFEKPKRDKERKKLLPVSNPIKRGAVRARPEQPKPPLALSPNQSRLMRLAQQDMTKPDAKHKGRGKGRGAKGQAMHWTGPSSQQERPKSAERERPRSGGRPESGRSKQSPGGSSSQGSSTKASSAQNTNNNNSNNPTPAPTSMKGFFNNASWR